MKEAIDLLLYFTVGIYLLIIITLASVLLQGCEITQHYIVEGTTEHLITGNIPVYVQPITGNAETTVNIILR